LFSKRKGVDVRIKGQRFLQESISALEAKGLSRGRKDLA